MMQQWFEDAKLGIFIHWGIYAVKGVSESWSFYHGSISYEDYMKQCDGFTAKNYDPEYWAELFKNIGAKYAVLTTKHHDGVALWDTKLSDLNVVKKTPAGKDLVRPFAEAMRKEGIKVGLYFSHIDWSHPDYASILREDEREAGESFKKHKYTHPEGEEDFEAWERFLKFHRGQLEELMTNFAPVDLLWFDGDWEKSAQQWRMKELREFLHKLNPNVVLNSRMWGYGDYKTPEQGIPIIRPEGPWEFCVTINDSWGYQHKDKNYKSVRQLIRMFADCIGMGGNMLLDIGPMEDGSIDKEQEKRLLGLGEWINKHKEAIYETKAGLPLGHFYGPTTLSKDNKTLYLFCFDKPYDDIPVKGIRNKIKKISVLGSEKELSYKKIGGAPWVNIPGILWIDVEDEFIDKNCTVIKVEFEEELDLYREAGQNIELN
ncbi:alpha-L-fucosidase [Caloramator quimbayensis]|uniref:alpha-L-fucosidase n=2 Tax=Caloramator quimbayensis TaxID=1147123 RepID=A0A1T4WG23_9CLOT|nr:alpha-L-fucosidase [Caloramator quimbayensis]